MNKWLVHVTALLIFVIAGVYFNYEKEQRLQDYKDNSVLDLQSTLLAAQISYKNVTEVILETVIQDPRNIKLLAMANKDKSKSDEARKQLLSQLEKPYSMLKNTGLTQLQFFLLGGESFLRMLSPDVHGDDVSKIRPSVANVLKYKKPVEGFEIGKLFAGFRYIYPLFYNGEFLGAVETSISMGDIRSFIGRIYPGLARFELKTTGLEVLDKTTLSSYVTQSSLSSEFVIEKNEKTNEKIQKINTVIASQARALMPLHKSFALDAKVDDRGFIILFLPLYNYDSSFAGYIVHYHEDSTPASIKKEFYEKGIFLAILGLFVFFIGYLQFVRDNRELENKQALISINHNFSNILNSINALVYAIDTKTHEIIFANKYTISKFGNIVGKICYEVMQKEQTEACDFCPFDSFSSHQASDWVYFNEITGEWYACNFKIIEWIDGKPAKLVSAIDITLLKNLQNELEDRVSQEVQKNMVQEQLLIQQSKLASMGEMIAAIAHQWKQPLNILSIIIGDIQDSHKYGELDKQSMANSGENALAQIEQMSKTIDDFKNFFSPNKHKTIFNVQKSVSDVLKLIGHQLKQKNISVKTNCDENIYLFGNENELKQVLLNLISNAQDVLVQNAIYSAQIDIFTKILGEEHFILGVKDNGGGVDTKIVDKIFESYFTTKGDEKGTGIGLYMSKMITEESFGGKIEVVNAPDGALFIMTLKRAQ